MCVCVCVCICYFSTNRPKDVQDSSAVPEEFSFTAFLASVLFAVLVVCVCRLPLQEVSDVSEMSH